MFYHMDVLCRKGGRFYVCWLADTYPKKFASLTRRRVFSQNIPTLCEDIMEVLNDENNNSYCRFSLRLSSQLIRGLARVYQKQAQFFIAEVYMMEASVLKKSRKIYKVESVVKRVIENGELPRITTEEVNVDNLEEQITTNTITVAHIDTITLKEPTLPENAIWLNDNFGELNPQQTIEELRFLSGDITLEAMLAQGMADMHVSAMETPLESDKTQDTASLDIPAQRVEKILDFDISMQNKSVGEKLPNIEKDIPKILSPVPVPAPNPDINLNKSKELLKAAPQPFMSQQVEEVVLEDLPKAHGRKRKLNKRRIDIDIQIPLSVYRTQIVNTAAETKQWKDIPELKYVSARELLSRMTYRGARILERFSTRFTNSYTVKINSLKKNNEKIFEPVRDEPEVMNISVAPQAVEKVMAQDVPMDISEMPTQHLAPATSPAPATSSASASAPTTSPALATSPASASAPATSPAPAEQAADTSALDTTASSAKRPSKTKAATKRQKKSIIRNETYRMEDIQKSLLQFMINLSAPPDGRHEQTLEIRRRSQDSSETPLGSLDRTPVSLGESDKSTESQRTLEEEFGPKGTFLKIYEMIKASREPITVQSLVSQGPRIEGKGKFAASRCFNSILKLKTFGFIDIEKKPGSSDIADMKFGKKILEILQSQ